LTIFPGAWILHGSMLRLLVARLPTLRSAMRSRRDLVLENLAVRPENGEVTVIIRVSGKATAASDSRWVPPRWGSLRAS